MTKKILIALVIILGVGGAIFIFTSSSDTNDSSSTKSSTTTPSSTTSETPNEQSTNTDASNLTLSEVAKHNSKSDCWTVIDGIVYDITSYIPRHEGGDNILSACGVDGTDFFNGEKAGQEGDTKRHSGSARSQLEQFELGKLN